MMSWFDVESSEMMFTEYLERMESWQKALSDGIIQPAEFREQADRVADLLRALEPKLNDELHAEVTQILYEWAVLQAMEKIVDLSEAERTL